MDVEKKGPAVILPKKGGGPQGCCSHSKKGSRHPLGRLSGYKRRRGLVIKEEGVAAFKSSQLSGGMW